MKKISQSDLMANNYSQKNVFVILKEMEFWTGRGFIFNIFPLYCIPYFPQIE